MLKNLSLISLQGVPVETLFDWCTLEDLSSGFRPDGRAAGDGPYEHKQWLLGLANAASFRLPDDHPLKPILLKGQGEINQTLSQYREALDVFRTMLDMPLDLPMRVFAYNRLAHNYWHCGDPERCVQIAQEGMALAETASPREMDAIVCEYSELMNRITEGNRDMDVGTSLVWWGDIYRAMGDSGKAAGCYAQAADIFRKRNCFSELA